MIDPVEVFRFEQIEKGVEVSRAIWRSDPGCPYFSGHFPAMPVLPAVGLLDGSLELLRALGQSLPAEKLALRKAKFSGMLVPGMEVRIHVTHKPDRNDVEWTNAANGQALAAFTFPR